MFPIRDHNPSGQRPLITQALIALNLLVFLTGLLLFPGESGAITLQNAFGLVPRALTAGHGGLGLITHMFLHAGWMHLAGNMLFLWIFGDNLEEAMGRLPYLGFYLGCGLAAAAAQYAVDPNSPVPMIGASGAIAGVLGGYLLLYPRARVDVLVIFIIFFRIFAIPAWITLGLWFGLQLMAQITAPDAAGGVAYAAHIGGFLAGVILTLPVWLRRGGVAGWAATLGIPDHPETQFSRSLIPVIRRRN